MATMVADDGHGTTLTLGTSTWDTNTLITSISPDAATRDAIETTHLSTTAAKSFIPADLVDNGGFSVEFIADQNSNTTNTSFTILVASAETATLTYSPSGSNANGATISGSAFCVEYNPPSASVGELKKGSAKFKWAGVVSYTVET